MHRIFILLADHVTPVIFIGGGCFFGLFVMLFLVAVGTEICFILLFRLICGLLLHFNTYSILHYQYIHWNFQYKPRFLQCIVFFKRNYSEESCKCNNAKCWVMGCFSFIESKNFCNGIQFEWSHIYLMEPKYFITFCQKHFDINSRQRWRRRRQKINDGGKKDFAFITWFADRKHE